MQTWTTHVSLLARLGGSDGAAWDEFYQRYGMLIRAVARRQGLQPADCDDIVQEVVMSLAQAMPTFRYDPQRGKFRAYLKTVVLRAIIRRARRRRGDKGLADLGDQVQQALADPQVESTWEEEWRRYHLRQAMRRIDTEFNEADRQAFELYAVKGVDARETAVRLNISIDQVYQAKSRITRRLSDLIAEQVTDEG